MVLVPSQGGIAMHVRNRVTMAFLAMTLLMVSGCGYNDLQGLDEDIKAAWSEVLNQYQRRTDLIPNLVETVKGYAAHEKETLTAVTQARAQVAGIKATPELLKDPDAFQKFLLQMDVKPNFTVADEKAVSKPPGVKF